MLAAPEMLVTTCHGFLAFCSRSDFKEAAAVCFMMIVFACSHPLGSILVMSVTSFYYRDLDQDFEKPSLDIETGIETFDNLVLISRLVLRLLKI